MSGKRRPVRVLQSLGGCGGTIIGRALCANGALVLSEVNPRSANLFGGALNPLVQMNRDHFARLPEALRAVDVHTLGHPPVFGRVVADLIDHLDVPLVLRDYSYVDYIGIPFAWPRPERACLAAALAPFGGMRAVKVVRHPAATYESLLQHPPLAGVLDAATFVAGHLAFLEDGSDDVMRYEDFLDQPETFVEALCARLDLPYRADWTGQLAATPALTGHARAKGASAVERPEPRPASRRGDDLRHVPGYDRLLRLAGYPR